MDEDEDLRVYSYSSDTETRYASKGEAAADSAARAAPTSASVSPYKNFVKKSKILHDNHGDYQIPEKRKNPLPPSAGASVAHIRVPSSGSSVCLSRALTGRERGKGCVRAQGAGGRERRRKRE